MASIGLGEATLRTCDLCLVAVCPRLGGAGAGSTPVVPGALVAPCGPPRTHRRWRCGWPPSGRAEPGSPSTLAEMAPHGLGPPADSAGASLNTGGKRFSLNAVGEVGLFCFSLEDTLVAASQSPFLGPVAGTTAENTAGSRRSRGRPAPSRPGPEHLRPHVGSEALRKNS